MSAPRRSARQRALGQNFLVDPNILDVIERLAQLSDGDIVLEVGGGPGVLSQRLAPRVAHLHVIELDPRLAPTLQRVIAPYDNVTVHVADATRIELGALSPAPTKMVANLPYSVAATVILRTIDELPSVRDWVVMVQREVGERLAAAPASDAYGVPSVLAQLACEVMILRPVSRTVFRPVPNVDSVLVGLRRHSPAPDQRVRRLVHEAFAHRRKALAGSLGLAAGASPDIRDRARVALQALGYPADVRAERLTPSDFVTLAERLWPR